MKNPLRDIWQTYVIDLIRETDEEAAEHRKKEPGTLHAKRLAIVIFAGALSMLIIRVCGNVEDPSWFEHVTKPFGLTKLNKDFVFAVTKAPRARLNQRIWFAAARIIAYAIVPALITKFALKRPLEDCGFRLRGASLWKTYLTLLCIVAPFIFMASYGTAFQQKYPYYRLMKGESLWPGFILWEILYASQFLGIEFFFRGFLIHGTRKSLGWGAVLLPIIPYLTIHFGKPLPEMIGSVITGFVLGTLSLKTRSIFGGWGVHACVAVSMDMLSIWHQGYL